MPAPSRVSSRSRCRAASSPAQSVTNEPSGSVSDIYASIQCGSGCGTIAELKISAATIVKTLWAKQRRAFSLQQRSLSHPSPAIGWIESQLGLSPDLYGTPRLRIQTPSDSGQWE